MNEPRVCIGGRKPWSDDVLQLYVRYIFYFFALKHDYSVIGLSSEPPKVARCNDASYRRYDIQGQQYEFYSYGELL